MTLSLLRLPLLTLLLLVSDLIAPAPATGQPRVKVFISVDMEGVGGVVSDQQLSPSGFEYQRFREFMTAEALAAIEGARAAGATEIVVADSHGNMQNLLIDRFPADVTIIRGPNRPLGMMHGIDNSFDAAVFIGYHSGTNNLEGVRAHTFSSARLTGVQLNGREVSESGFNAWLAGSFGVPVVAISGDDAAVAELLELVPNAGGAVVKEAIGFHAAATRTPEASQALIREAVRVGLSRRAQIEPLRWTAPVVLEVAFKHYRAAELLGYLPIVERTSAHSIRYRAPTMSQVAEFLAFISSYEPDLTP